jgi:hypothetical protein
VGQDRLEELSRYVLRLRKLFGRDMAILCRG